MQKLSKKTGLLAYYILFLLISNPFTAQAQQSKWELGIGLRPLDLEDEPYTIMLKKHISPRVGLRFGFSGMYKSSSEHFFYIHPYYNSLYSFSYEYTLIEHKIHASTWVGLQYQIGRKNSNSKFFWYGASDVFFKYRLEYPYVPKGVRYLNFDLRPGDYVVALDADQRRTLGVGFRQSCGVRYFLNGSFSVSTEASFYYEISHTKKVNLLFAGIRNESIGGTGFIGGLSAPMYDKDFRLGFSPVMQVSFNYHF